MRTIKIGEIKPYLKEGYKLIVQTNNFTDKSDLTLMIDNKIIGIEEVDIDEFMKLFPNITSFLSSFHKFYVLRCDNQKEKVI